MPPAFPAVIESHRGQIAALAERHRVETLALFGSAATGEFDGSRSDIDFLVTFRGMSPAEHAEAYFGLLESLENLLDRRVDLLEEGAISNRYLRQSIEVSKRMLYAA
jgi:uncharacterized protein